MEDSSSDPLSTVITKLDTHFYGSELTETTKLQQQELTITLTNLTGKDIRCLIFGRKEYVIEHIDSPCPSSISNNFMVGDVIVKINGRSLDHHCNIANLMTARNKVGLLRAYASVPSESRLRITLSEISLTKMKGCTYQVITCNKNLVRHEKLAETTFGFNAVLIGNKLVVVRITKHSAAEKFFAIGDAILDVNGRVLRPSNPSDVRVINPLFQSLGEVTILIERPVIAKLRKDAVAAMKSYLVLLSTEPTMAQDSVDIGVKAGMMHQLLWRRLKPVSILLTSVECRQREKGRKKKTKSRIRKTGDTSSIDYNNTDDSRDCDMSRSNCKSVMDRVVVDDQLKNFLQISSDVSENQELERIGSRYSDDESSSTNDKIDKKMIKMKNSSLVSLLETE